MNLLSTRSIVMRALVASAGAFLLVACGTPSADEYDRRCESNDDCAIVTFPTCDPCEACGDLAIAAHEVEKFGNEQSALCLDQTELDEECPIECPGTATECVAGICELLRW